MISRGLRLGADGRLADAGFLEDRRLHRILDVLNGGGEETRVVGGAVRNALLGEPPGDLDLATTALPDDVMARAKAARLRTIPTGLSHGTVTVMVEGLPFEVTTLREDIETDGRHAIVRFGRDFVADAERRDFTVNALSLGADGRIFDSVGGVRDLAAGRIRFIGEAGRRIAEDYLRILRFFRFHARYGAGELDAEGLTASVAGRDGLLRLSRERIRAEMFKLLVAPGSVPVLGTMALHGFVDILLGKSGRLDRLARLAALELAAPDPVLRLAALAAEDGLDAADLRDRLRLSNAETDRLAAAVAAQAFFLDTPLPPPTSRLRLALFEHGRAASLDGLLLAAAEAATPGDSAAWEGAWHRLQQAQEPRLPFAGADVTARGLKGAAVGRVLKHLREAWAAAEFPNDPAVVSAMLDAAVEGECGSGALRN